jgi:hypothetical protein
LFIAPKTTPKTLSTATIPNDISMDSTIPCPSNKKYGTNRRKTISNDPCKKSFKCPPYAYKLISGLSVFNDG